MRHAITLLFVVGLAGVSTVRAQDEAATGHRFAFQYTIAVPMGNTRDFIDKASLRGFTLDYKFHFNDVASVGISLGWSVFYQKMDYGTYTIFNETMSLTGEQYRYINSVPIFATFNYFLPTGRVSPFVGLGIGTTYNSDRMLMGLYGIDVDSWHFTLAPELGVKINVASGLSGFFSARYNHSFETTNLRTQSYMGLNIGMLYGL